MNIQQIWKRKGLCKRRRPSLLEARTEGKAGGVPEAAAQALLPRLRALSVTSSVLQRGGVSFLFVHAVCGVCSHLYRCAHVQQLACGMSSSLKSCEYKLYADFLNPVQKALFLQLGCWMMALFSVGKQRVNAIPSPPHWQIQIVHQERLFLWFL